MAYVTDLTFVAPSTVVVICNENPRAVNPGESPSGVSPMTFSSLAEVDSVRNRQNVTDTNQIPQQPQDERRLGCFCIPSILIGG